MKQPLPSPITDENFNQAWDYANNKLIEIKKKKLIRKIIALVANVIFLFCACFVLFNIAFHLPLDGLDTFLSVLGPLGSIITFFEPILYHPELHIVIQILIYLTFLFSPAFICSAIITLIVWFTYPVAKPLLESEDKVENAKTLSDALFESRFREEKVGGISSLVSAGAFTLIFLFTPTIFLLFVSINPELLGGDTAALLIIQSISIVVQSFGAFIFFLFYGSYCALNEMLSKMLQPFYRTKIDPTVEKDAKNYYYESDPALKEEFEEEERILARAIEIKAKRRQEEADLIAKITYKNPIYKYIKLGIVTLILIIAFVFVGNKLKSVDIDKLLNEIGVESTETEAGTEVNYE